MNAKIGSVRWKSELTHQVDIVPVYRDGETGTAYICEGRPEGSKAAYIELADYQGGFFWAMVVPPGFGPEKELGWDGVLR